MYRGTTPTLKVRVKGIDLAQLESVYFTIKQGKTEITKTREDLTFEEENVLSVYLSQEDTLLLTRGYVYVQIRAATEKWLAENSP